MHQNVLIVFISFLLIAILLLLAIADGREKSKRIRVLVDLSGNPDEKDILYRISPSLQKMAADSHLHFVLADEQQFSDSTAAGLYTAGLAIHTQNRESDKNEIHILPGERKTVHLLLASPEALEQDLAFLNQIAEALIQAGQPIKQP